MTKSAKFSKIVRAIEASLLDAKVSRAMFEREISNPSPAPISLRIFFKAFVYSLHEVIDFAAPQAKPKGSALERKFAELNDLTKSCPMLRYLKEARDSISHNPNPIMEVSGGWERVPQPEMNPDGTFNLPFRHEHIPGFLSLFDVPPSRTSPAVPVPIHGSGCFQNHEISQMMNSIIASIEKIVVEIGQLTEHT